MNVAETAQTVTTEYNGWSNYETWVVNLWLTNDQRYYEELCSIVSSEDDLYDKAEALEDWLRFEYDGEYASVWADLANHSLTRVNWCEIIENNQE